MCFLQVNCRVSLKYASSSRLPSISCILWFKTSMCIFCQKRSSISGHSWCKFYSKSSKLALISQTNHRQNIKNNHKQNNLKGKTVMKIYIIIKDNPWLSRFKLFLLLSCKTTHQYNLCWVKNSKSKSIKHHHNNQRKMFALTQNHSWDSSTNLNYNRYNSPIFLLSKSPLLLGYYSNHRLIFS